MSGILILYPLPGSLGPQTPPKNGATSLQSSDFGWNLQSKHHHHFIDGLVGLRMTYVGYFDIIPIAWKSQTPNPLKKQGHWPPKSKIKTFGGQWPPVFGRFGQGSIHENTRNKSSGGQLGHLWSDDDALIENFIQNQNFGGQWSRFFGGLGVRAFKARSNTSKYPT